MKTTPLTYTTIFYLLASLLFTACESEKKQTEKEQIAVTETVKIVVPEFNADTAYYYIEKQLGFGPRVPNTLSHRLCADYLVNELKKMGAEVIVQPFEAVTFNNIKLQSKNIIASTHLTATKRILLAAHWDSRPFADQDSINQKKPIPGANDGGSGVAVLLEIIRTIQNSSVKPNVGIDVILFDSEDYGAPDWESEKRDESGASFYCLGSQYWAKNKHKNNYTAYYGILLDMVGAKDARFTMEGQSMNFAPKIVNKVWNTAAKIGYNNYFVAQTTSPIMDDHYFVNTIANIPMIDIIHYDKTNDDPFFAHWHKHSDDLSQIDKQTLKAVGQTLLQVIYEE